MLTRRSSQFLEKVKKLHAETREPVHYTTVANLLGVSRWTAYDMLKSLEKQGYVKAEYSLNPGGGKAAGRSQVVFAPTGKSLDPDSDEHIQYLEDWHQTKEKVIKFFESLQYLGPPEIIDRILRVPNVDVPFVFCAYAIGMLVAAARARRRWRMRWFRKMLSRYSRPELGLAGFTGTALGLILGASDSLQAEEAVLGFVERLQKQLTKVSSEEKHLLFDFVKEALA